jgi:predicted MFS family arabinose efflux permease
VPSGPVLRPPSGAIVAAICGAEILGLAGYSTVPALLPQLIKGWSLTNTEGGWLVGIMSAGYMVAAVPLVSLTDRRPARRIYLASSALGALSCFGVALCDSLLPAIGFRAVAGIALAGMYMPGLQALTSGVEGTKRARIAALYTSSFTIGVSLSFLLSRIGTLLGWRSAFFLAGALSTAGVVVAWAALPQADPPITNKAGPELDYRAAFGNRDSLILIFAYAAAIWGSAGLRQWIVVFLAFCAATQTGLPAQTWGMLAVGALISSLGVPAGLLGNELSIRYGLRNIATLVFLLSALAGGLFGFTAMLPYFAVVCLAVLVGFTVQGNFANLTSGVLAVAPRRSRGRTIGWYSCIGFGGGFLGTLLFGITLDQFGGTSRAIAWTVSFATCGLACLAGSVATAFLSREVWHRRA